tara:strand:+ start:91 stop:471 length:381 start_codon:yes stop_codon:yes gene_type:complete
MPVKKKLFELQDGKKVWVRQASGLEKLKIEGIHAQAIRKCRHFGPDMQQWTDDQMDEFWEHIEAMGGGLTSQIEHLIPLCIMGFEDGSNCDVNLLLSEEIIPMLPFVKGETGDEEDSGSVPLDKVA